MSNIMKLAEEGIARWREAFNRQDAQGCAQQYAADAMMHAKPFGQFVGQTDIQAFWQGIIDQGLADVVYTNEKWIKIDEDTAMLKAEWQMNKAFGVVHYELWAKQEDGTVRLVYDQFEAQGEK